MDKKIVGFSEDGQISKLVELLKNVPDTELQTMIDNRALRGKGEVLPLLQGILHGLPSTEPNGTRRSMTIYQHCIKILEKNEMSNKSASNMVGLLMLEADALPGTAVAELCDAFVDMVKDGSVQGGKSLELLPKLLSVLCSEETVVQGGRSGSEYKNHVLNSLCACRWSSQSIIHLAAMFKDVTLTKEELKFVVDKIIRMFKEVDMKDVPSLVYQLLLLSAKGHKRKVMEGITSFFIEQDNKQREKPREQNELSEDLLESGDNNEETLRHMEGTVILHIYFAVKLDQELGREFIKFLKSKSQSSEVLSPFNLALSLCISCFDRFEDQVLDFLKTTIVKSFKDGEKHSQSRWVRDTVTQSCEVLNLVLETVKNSTYGWDHVIQGLVRLGFVLMDSFGPKAVFGRVEEIPAAASRSPTHRACHLGSELLLSTFKAHEMVTVDILDQIFNRIITKATVSHYLELLTRIVQSSPLVLLDCSPKVRETFDTLHFLNPVSVDGFLMAIQPLLKYSMSLKDALIIVLRKAMFSRQLDPRKIGVNGFLMILKHFRVLGGLQPSQASQSYSSSQVQVDIHARYNPSSNEALCLEIMGILRRVLTQQADVRLLFYQGIYDVLCRNTQLQGSILEILLSQLKKYFESCEDVNPPIKLEQCIATQGDQVYLQEPLAHLIGCIQRCLLKISDIRRQQTDYDDESEEDVLHTKSELEDMMESMVRRMVKSEMEDFELDKSSDFSLGNSVGVKNNIFAIIVLGTYEVLIEYTFTSGQFSESSIEEVLQLHSNYNKLSSVLKDKAHAAAGKKGKVATSKTPQSLLSLDCVTAILNAVVNDTAASHKEAVAQLRESLDFQKFVANIALQKVHQLQDKKKDGDSSKTLRILCQLGSIFLKYYAENQTIGEERRREKTICGPCLEGLVSIVTILTQQHQDQISSCLCDIVGLKEQEDQQEIVYNSTKKFQRLVMNILVADDHHNWKEVAHLLNIINQLCRQLSTGGQHFEKVQDWVYKICSERNIDDIATCKLLFGMLLGLTQQVRSSPSLLRDLAQDIHSQLGDIDQEVQVEDSTHFSLVTHRTAAPTVLLQVLTQIDRELDDTEWVINRLKADISTETDIEDINPTQQEGQEKAICTRLGILVTAFHELVQCAIPVGVCVEAMVKQMTKMYGTLTLLVKYYISLYTQRAGHLTSRFEKLMKLIGTHLTQYCYAMITYIQTVDSEHMQQNADKGKKDKKKATAAAQAGRARVLKQSKSIPNFIFAIETFEKFLIQLSKKSKVNLMEHMKSSICRDFRINVAAVKAAIEETSDDEESDDSDNDGEKEMDADNQSDAGSGDNSEDESNQENRAPANKRPHFDEAGAVSKKIKLGKKSSVNS